jgi:hypothetical protein
MMSHEKYFRLQDNFTLKKPADFLFAVLFIFQLDFLVRYEPARLIATSWWRASVDSISPNLAAAHRRERSHQLSEHLQRQRSFRR